MADEVQQVRIGDLLMQAGILTSEYINKALDNFEKRGLPIGKVLVASGYLTEQQLRTALDVQSMVNDGLLPLNVAAAVLQIAHQSKVPLVEAFQQSGYVQPEDQQTNKLGQLLVGADIVSNKEVDEALQTNIRTGLPLGHILCFRGAVSQALVYTALLAQNLIRRGMIDRGHAMQALRAAHQRELELERTPTNKGYQRLPMKPSLRLGELLVQSRILSEDQLLEALHRSLMEKQPLGVILSGAGLVPEAVVNSAVEIQEMLDNGTLKEPMAVESMLLIRGRNISASQAVAEVGAFKPRTNKSVLLMQILCTSGKLAVNQIPRDIQTRLEVNYNQAADVCRLIVEHQLVPEHLLYNALRCVYLLDEKVLTMQQAIMALDFSVRLGLSIDETMIQLGWTARTRLRS